MTFEQSVQLEWLRKRLADTQTQLDTARTQLEWSKMILQDSRLVLLEQGCTDAAESIEELLKDLSDERYCVFWDVGRYLFHSKPKQRIQR